MSIMTQFRGSDIKMTILLILAALLLLDNIFTIFNRLADQAFDVAVLMRMLPQFIALVATVVSLKCPYFQFTLQ